MRFNSNKFNLFIICDKLQGLNNYPKLDLIRLGLKKLEQLQSQHAKEVVSDSPGLVDFAIRLVNSVFNLPDGQVMFFEEFE